MELVPPCLLEIETEPSTGCTIGVDDAGFDITAGETFVIMGLSGFGKSTLLRLLNLLIEPIWGSVEIGGKSAAR